MRNVRSIIAQSPAIAISLVALVFALGSGAGYAATTANQPATKVTFHVLHLVHGWTPGAATIAAGEPAYGTNGDGIVFLSGWLSRSRLPKGAQGTFAILPVGLRPTHQEDVTFTTVEGTTAVAQITPDGGIFIFGKNAPAYTSLDGVSFAIDG